MSFWLLVVALAAIAVLVLTGAAGYIGALPALTDLLTRPVEATEPTHTGIVATAEQQRAWRQQHRPIPLCLPPPPPASPRPVRAPGRALEPEPS